MLKSILSSLAVGDLYLWLLSGALSSLWSSTSAAAAAADCQNRLMPEGEFYVLSLIDHVMEPETHVE